MIVHKKILAYSLFFLGLLGVQQTLLGDFWVSNGHLFSDFINVTSDNILDLTDSCDDVPNAVCAQYLTRCITSDNISDLSRSTYIIEHILEVDPDCAQQLTRCITLENITEINSNILSEIIKQDPDCSKQLTQFITLENITEINSDIVSEILKADPTSSAQFMVKNIKELPSEVIIAACTALTPIARTIVTRAIQQACQDAPKCESIMENAIHNFSLNKLAQHFGYTPCSATNTPYNQLSEQHFSKNILNSSENQLTESPIPLPVKLTLIQLIRKERTEQSKGRYTLLHAQKTGWTLRADIFKRLIELVSGRSIGDYHCLRFRAADCTHHSFDVPCKDFDSPDQDHLIFMKHALFGNSDYWRGESSLAYFLNNANVCSDCKPLKELFSEFGLDNHYDKYKERFDQLDTMLQSDFGSLLLFSFTPEQLNKSVYISHPCGYKRTAIISGCETNCVSELLDTLRTDANRVLDDNHLVYCGILNDREDGLLNPWNLGMRTYTFCPAQTAAYRQLMDDTFNDIARDIIIKQTYMHTAHQAAQQLYPFACFA